MNTTTRDTSSYANDHKRFDAWHHELRKCTTEWRTLLPKTPLGVAGGPIYLVSKPVRTDKANDACEVDRARWPELEGVATATIQPPAASHHQQTQHETALAGAAHKLARCLERTPAVARSQFGSMREFVMTTADALRRHPDPGTLSARNAVKRICTEADKIIARRQNTGIDPFTMAFVRQPAVAAMLTYAARRDIDDPISIEELRGAIGRAGHAAEKRTIEELLRQARDRCLSCQGSDCHVRHFGLFTYRANSRRNQYVLTRLGRLCALELMRSCDL